MSSREENIYNDGETLSSDKLVFGENITVSDLSFERNNYDLIIIVAEGTEMKAL